VTSVDSTPVDPPFHRSRQREFYSLWIAATSTYGVGDIVTTIALVDFVSELREANPLVRWAMSAYGIEGLVAIKLAAFMILIWVSLLGSRDHDRFLYYFPPIVLTLVGVFLTASNLWLLFTV